MQLTRRSPLIFDINVYILTLSYSSYYSQTSIYHDHFHSSNNVRNEHLTL